MPAVLIYNMKKTIFLTILILMFFFAGFGFGENKTLLFGPDQAENKQTENPFQIKAFASPDQVGRKGKGKIRIVFNIAPKHKIYEDSTSIIPKNIAGFNFYPLIKPLAVKKKDVTGKTERFFTGKAVFELPFETDGNSKPGPVQIPIVVKYRGCTETNCFFPETKEIKVNLNIVSGLTLSDIKKSVDLESKSPQVPKETPLARTAARFGLIGVMIMAFMWGFLASLTPCIYPLIPITVSVIGAGNSKNILNGFMLSVFYVLGMSLTYAGFGVAAAWSGGLFGQFTDLPAVQIIVSGVFFLLALSMFDVFTIQMPSWLTSRMGSGTGKGFIGVFITGAAAGMVVGPCVGPLLVGLLIYIATLGSKIQGFLIMWSFAMGMGMLFLVIGTFSGAASSLPKSGDWMVKIKHLFGILMLGFSLYYIKPLLPHNIFLLCLGGLLIGVGIYIGALDPIKDDTGASTKLWKSIGILCLTLGIAYAARFAMGEKLLPQMEQKNIEASKINWYLNEDRALAIAGKQGKPVMIDFTADWCSSCKRLDAKTFSDPEIIRMADNFIAVRVDNSDTKDIKAARLRKKYGIMGLPSVIFLDPGGNIIKEHTITEFIGPAMFLERMRAVNQILTNSREKGK